MCAHLKYCVDCRPTSEIQSYTEGRTHLIPVFGDVAQSMTTMMLRRKRFKQLLNAFDPSVYSWPEYRKLYGYTGYVQRIIRLGRSVLLSRKTMPNSLRMELDQARARISALHGPRSVNSRHGRREYKRIYVRWVKHNLAEAELATLGRIVYGKKPATSKTTDLIQLFGVDSIGVTARADRELAVA